MRNALSTTHEPPDDTTWYKGERCTVVAFDRDTYAQPMVLVRFADGREGIYKTSELGLKLTA